MELNEFIERFLPDYKNKENTQLTGRNSNGFMIDNFSEALQNFTNKICEEQRENCCEYAKGIDFSYGNNSCKLLEVEQPKIEEL